MVKEGNWIGQCITLCDLKDLKAQPEYDVDDGVGPQNSKIFTCTATLHGYPDVKVVATGLTKKSAKTEAAHKLLSILGDLPEGPDAEEKRQKRAMRQQKQQEFEASSSNQSSKDDAPLEENKTPT